MGLTARGVLSAKPGYHGDGDGLYLQVAPGGSKSWIFRYQRQGKRRELGLGGVKGVSLAEARDRAIDARRLLANGIDPIEAKHAESARTRIAAARAITFKQASIRYIAAHRAGWRNAKHAAQWAQTLEAYCFPVFGGLPVNAVDTALVLQAVEPIWTAKPATAGRVRGRIEAVLDWSKARGYRAGENPARWRGHLDHLLPAAAKVHRAVHHPALPYGEVGGFMQSLRAQQGVAARALEFAIVTCTRTKEARLAKWDEFNLAERLWVIPPERMKGNREHRVPLSEPALAVLQSMAAIRSGDYVFPGSKPGQPLGVMALAQALHRIRGDLTVHGFRSTFSDWCAERTAFPSEVREMALAHKIANAVEAAYRRGDLFEKRRELMRVWADYCGQPAAAPGEVVPLRSVG
jgi:integrase